MEQTTIIGSRKILALALIALTGVGCTFLNEVPGRADEQTSTIAPVVEPSIDSLTLLRPDLAIPNRVSMPAWDGGMSLVYEEELEQHVAFHRMCNAQAPEYPHTPVLATLVAVGDPRYRPVDDIIASVGHHVPQVRMFAFQLRQDRAARRPSVGVRPNDRLQRTVEIESFPLLLQAPDVNRR